MPLSDDQLRTLRATLQELDARGLSRAELTKLVGVAPDGVTLTIDMGSQELLGQPLVVATIASKPGSAACFEDLTPREREVAALVAAGLRNADIALALDLALSTTKDHVHRILRKSGLDSRAQVASVWNA